MKRLTPLIIKRYVGIVILIATFSLTSCSDKVDESNMYTFTGETIYSYLQESEDYTDFAYILSKVKLSDRSESELSQLLSARGNYTVFAPNNQAVRHYLDSIYQDPNYDITQIPDSTAKFIARNAIIDNENTDAYKSTDFIIGALEKTNIDDRYITVDFDTLSGGKLATIINNSALVTQPDIEVTNGMIHGIDKVLELSRETLPTLIQQASNLRIFSELLHRTGWDDSMNLVRDEDYEINHEEFGPNLDASGTIRNPEHRYYGFTAFVETDSVFQNLWGIPAPILNDGLVTNMEEIMSKITEKCAEAYPDATDKDLTSLNNPVNQFIAYHLLPERIPWEKLVVHYIEMGYGYSSPDQLSINCFEYYETMGPHRRLMKLTDGKDTDGKRINRYSTYNYANFREVSCPRPGILISNSNGDNLSNSKNGFYYPIDQILIYDKDVPGVVLNERIRWDVSSLLPEIITNGYRRISDNSHRTFPRGYFKDLTFTAESRCLLLPYYNTASQSNYQADEFNIRGQYDFVFKLPPVPNEGTYELRFCAPSNTGFGMAQFYFGTNKTNLQPVGLPVDLRIPPSNAVIGWKQDVADEDVNEETDKNMRNHAYMKPPMHDGIANNGAPVTESMRNTTSYVNNLRLRKIIWTGNVKPETVYYIRVKSVLENTQACFLLDYMEWCPKHVYNGAEKEDKW